MPKGVKLSNKSEFRHKHLLSYTCYYTRPYWAACEPVRGGGVCRDINSAGTEQHWPNELMITC